MKTDLKFLVSDDIVLECELSRANVGAKWCKNNCPVEEDERYCEEEEGAFRSLVILNAGLEDSGEYSLDVGDDNISFNVTVEGRFIKCYQCKQLNTDHLLQSNFCVFSASEPPVKIVGNSNDLEYQDMMVGDDLILACEVSRVSAPVQWYCNDRLLVTDSRTLIESYGTLRKIIISNIQSSDSGKYVCDAVDDKMTFLVRIQG